MVSRRPRRGAARGPLGKLRDRALSPLLLGMLGKVMLPPLNAVRAEQGLAALRGTDEIFLRPPLLLNMTAPPFEYRRSDLPESVLMIGACAWEPPAEQPDWLAGCERPLVLVTTSSEFQNDGRLIEVAFEALAGEDVDVIATAPAEDVAGISVPDNGRVVSFTPHLPILERAVCAITHGGMGATQKALSIGVPVCAVPFGRDQLEVARRVVGSGSGTMLKASKLSPQRLRTAVSRARAKSAGAERVAEGYAATGGAETAADAIERLI